MIQGELYNRHGCSRYQRPPIVSRAYVTVIITSYSVLAPRACPWCDHTRTMAHPLDQKPQVAASSSCDPHHAHPVQFTEFRRGLFFYYVSSGAKSPLLKSIELPQGNNDLSH
ncbi:hypothetical protein RRG08_016456 [Elysia crispata]|uniref:Uncharacterized protein n=1 Tax=Elysia crispata TaxID=231223 RepID=A0AAE1CV12_9GAST|nr:hypothetical protein RRG08_016456 [Elysia crispata]